MYKGNYFKDISNQFNRFHGTSCSEQGLLGIAGGSITWSTISLETSIQVINVYTLVKSHKCTYLAKRSSVQNGLCIRLFTAVIVCSSKWLQTTCMPTSRQWPSIQKKVIKLFQKYILFIFQYVNIAKPYSAKIQSTENGRQVFM